MGSRRHRPYRLGMQSHSCAGHDPAIHRMVFESLADPIVVVDGTHRILEANRAARESSVDVAQLLTTENRDPALDLLFAALRGDGRASAELRLVDPTDQPRILELDAITLDADRYAIVIRDVTERRELESEIAHLRRVESLGFLTASVVHDFNNMLTPILCFSGELVAQLEPGSRLSHFAIELRFAAERAAALIRQLLAFARREPDNPLQLDVMTVLTDLRPLLERAVGEEVDLVLVLEHGAGDVEADRDQLEQVALNLVVNARDALPRGGRITIRALGATLDETQGRASKCLPGEYIAISVTDNGLGMPPEVKARIFDPFFSTKRREHGSGLGLGLTTTHRFAVRHRGAIDVQSELGLGTTITIYLPRVGEGGRSSSQKETSEPRGTEAVVVVDDDEGVRNAARNVLENLGYRVVCASSVSEAFNLFVSGGLHVDLLLTDVVMPITSGRRLVDALAEAGVRPKVLFMSGHTKTIVQEHGVDDSTHFLPKPFSASELARKVREALDS